MSTRRLLAARPAPPLFALAAALALVGPAWSAESGDASPTPLPADVAQDPPGPVDESRTAAVPASPTTMASDAPGTAPPPDAATAASGEPVDPPTDTTPATSDEPPPPAVAATGASPTAAEDDFEALYGDPAAPDGAPVAPAAYDPWERYNRTMHRFNNAVDRRVARPLAQAYVRAVPAPVRGGVSNFFSNLGQPVTAVNALLQGRPRHAAHSLGRFVLNSTLGIGGVFDPATAARLDNRNEDFGQTLGVWGWKRSRYVELPLFGPRTLRDVVGMAGDAPLSPLRQVDVDAVRIPLQGLQLVDVRSQLLSTDALREGVEDDYALVRDAWSQRRAYQISSDRRRDESSDEPTVVPVDAMPVRIGGD